MKRVEALISEIRQGNYPQWVLLHGDSFQVHSASKALLDLLAPEQERAFNLEHFDGRAATWQIIDMALRTPPFLQGRKVVFVEDPPYFLSREHKGESSEKALQLWREGNRDESARLFLDLLTVEGWTSERWEALRGSFPAGEAAQIFGADEPGLKEEVEAIFGYCRSRGMALDPHRGGEGHGLMELIDQGLPPWAILMITASQVDRRTRLYKRFAEIGAVLDLALQRDRTGRVSREAVAEFLERRLRETGKKIEGKARELILMRAGDGLWAVHGELEKLFLYVGEEPWIRVKDVEEVFLDRAEAWVFDLTGALATRDSVRALEQLAYLLSQGEHPLKLLATLASEVRRMLAVRQLIEGEFRQRWSDDMSYPQFQKVVLQEGPPLVTRSPYGDFQTFQKAANFATAELLGYLGSIYRTDIRLKSSGKSPRVAMERLVLEMCRRER